jgi:hypothetical protein
MALVVTLFLYLIKQNTKKAYGRTEIWLNLYLTSATDENNRQDLGNGCFRSEERHPSEDLIGGYQGSQRLSGLCGEGRTL